MKHDIQTPEDIGALVRASRKASRIRIDDMAASASISKQTLGDLELGKSGVQIGNVLLVLKELGIHMVLDAPSNVSAELAKARTQIMNTSLRRAQRLGGKPKLVINSDAANVKVRS